MNGCLINLILSGLASIRNDIHAARDQNTQTSTQGLFLENPEFFFSIWKKDHNTEMALHLYLPLLLGGWWIQIIVELNRVQSHQNESPGIWGSQIDQHLQAEVETKMEK